MKLLSVLVTLYVCVCVIEAQSTKVFSCPSLKFVKNMNGKNMNKETQRHKDKKLQDNMTSVPTSS